ncbi:MAG TPA: helix-turn-helix transcriptional regulator [Longimicrobiales bacterium]|nr:helix-turn-helix transcriptional regulator [Longimicrobiales bacterium]
MTDMRMTHSTAAVLQALDAGLRYGFDIVEATGIRGGTVYPVLRRLEAAGLVASEWESPEIGRRQGRPSRKYYELLPSATGVVDQARARYPLPGPVNGTPMGAAGRA